MYKKFLKDTSALLVSQIVSIIASFLIGIIIARKLGPEGKGTIRLLTLLPSMIASFGTLGVNISTPYFLSKKKWTNQIIISNAIFVSLILSVIVLVVYPFVIPKFFSSLKITLPYWIKFITYFMVPIYLFWGYIFSFLQGLHHFITISIMDIQRTILSLIFITVFLLILNLGTISVVMVYIFVSLGPLILGIYKVKKLTDAHLYPQYNKIVLKETLTFGIKGHLANIAQYLNYRLDFFIVAYLLNSKEVGIYSVAVTLGEFIWYIPKAIHLILFPQVASKNRDESKKMTIKIIKYASIFIIGGAIILFFIGKNLILFLYGKEFIASVKPLILLLPGITCFAFCSIIAAYIAGRGKIEYNTIGSFVSLIATVILDIILIPKIGICGAAIASSCSYIIATLIAIFYYNRIGKCVE